MNLRTPHAAPTGADTTPCASRKRRWWPAAFAGCALLWTLTARDSRGFSYYLLSGTPVAWSTPQSVRFLSPSTFPPGSVAEVHVLEAMGLWNLVPACDFQYAYSRLDQDYPIDHFDGYNDTAAVPAWQLDPGVLGVTYLVNDGPEWFDMDVVFSDLPLGVGYTFDPNPSCDVVHHPLPTNGFSFLLVAVHELGHALGLGHEPVGDEPPGSAWFVATMNPRYPSGGPMGQENIIELHTDDRAGARFLYPHAGPSGPAYPDLALPAFTTGSSLGQAVPLYFDPPAVYPGDPLTARSVIENLGTTNEFFVRQGFYLSDDPWIDAADRYLGSLLWDIPFQEALQFEAVIDMPADLPAGSYYLGSILDDLDEVDEEYEDNNAASYCDALTVAQLAPVISPLGQRVVACDAPFVGPTPALVLPLNMGPASWSLDNPQLGMTINRTTGVISWSRPVHSPFPYLLQVRATNGAGTSTQVLYLGVLQSAPQIVPLAMQDVSCQPAFSGPVPLLTQPQCMNPIILWSIDSGPPGLAVNPTTGVLSWPEPVPADGPYTVTIRASNGSGSGTTSLALRVTPGDFDGDAGVRLSDLPALLDCLTGPHVAQNADCTCGNLDGDADVDLTDVSDWLARFGR
ncbi:MAG: matrixin family metalloprotease [Planctomycetes bacterium]|nr:matrixin family metalloprotease [Planctomycetota bacterium]